MVRILAISNLYPPHHLGGYELSCRDVMERLASQGHEVTVLTTVERRPGVDDPPGERAGATTGVSVRRDLEWWWDDHVLTSPPLPRRVTQEARAQRALRAALRDARPDVVSIWNMGAMSLGLLATVARSGTPAVFNVCDDWLVYGPKLDAWTRMFDGGRTRRLAGVAATAGGLPARMPDAPWPGAYLFVSDATRREAAARTGWEPEMSAVVGSGIDPADFPVAGGVIDDRPWRGRLLYVGRVEHRKGVGTAIRALAALTGDATLDIVGPIEPAYAPELDALIDECGVRERVDVASDVPRAALRARYREADAFLFPSEWAEPFGLVPIEAMACDVPVVATGTGGSAEFLVDGHNCVLFQPGDPASLAAAITRVADDAALRRRLVAGGRETASWASVDDLADVVTAWHLYAAGGFAGARPPDRRPPRPL